MTTTKTKAKTKAGERGGGRMSAPKKRPATIAELAEEMRAAQRWHTNMGNQSWKDGAHESARTHATEARVWGAAADMVERHIAEAARG